ncbi:lipid asymmetry maintenance protein MlaB [Colwellia psychrerythraea]|uniref:Sulfate transporter/antisigma-factor antagonist STAS n=1 Tax=Colwellia psychrerythraea TaxID=28229 RepID=A0A099KPD9_COLPS|nr:STAS domain-containing protein [Colwellia psychrerythraea]KGJ91792.1 Sulfate transporter/antisigma-factor antagonist STAS [Colwellia psychrerythraea]
MAEIKVIQKRDNSTEITISGELTIYCAMEAFQQHFQQLKVKEKTLFKLGNISEIDTAGVQLLVMLMKIVSEQSSSYRVVSLGEALTDYSNLFQLNRYFVDFADISALTSGSEEDKS